MKGAAAHRLQAATGHVTGPTRVCVCLHVHQPGVHKKNQKSSRSAGCGQKAACLRRRSPGWQQRDYRPSNQTWQPWPQPHTSLTHTHTRPDTQLLCVGGFRFTSDEAEQAATITTAPKKKKKSRSCRSSGGERVASSPSEINLLTKTGGCTAPGSMIDGAGGHAGCCVPQHRCSSNLRSPACRNQSPGRVWGGGEEVGGRQTDKR